MLNWWTIGLFLVGLAIIATSFVFTSIALSKDYPDDGSMLPGLPPWRAGSVPFVLVVDEEIVDHISHACDIALQFWDMNVPGLWVSPDNMGTGAVIPVLPSWKLAIPMPNGAVGWVRLAILDGHTWSAAIYLDMDRVVKLRDLSLWRMIAHEMGHVVGLAHDSAVESLMFPMAVEIEPALTGSDRQLLEDIHVQRKATR